jgi:predicted permease
MKDDLRDAARMFRLQPAFAAAALLMLAFGIGATTAIFTVVNAVLINPLPYRDSDALVSIVHTVDGRDEPFFGDAIYNTYRENTRAFEDFGVWTPYANVATVTGRSQPEEIRALTLSRGVLTTLGVRPAAGRIFSEADDAPRAPDTVMLSHAYWQREFGADPSVVDRVVTINARPHRIIGVIPAGFTFAGESDIVLPIRIDPARPVPLFRLRGVARLKAGVTMEQANADVNRILALWRTNYPMSPTDPFRNTRYGPSLRLLKRDVVGDVGRTLWVLMATIGIVLLMACSNVANLLLVRTDARAHELAIRTALGASWTRIARLLLAESMMLAFLGGALGVAVAYGSLRLLVTLGPANLPRLAEVSVDGTTLTFALFVSLVTGVLFGLAPVVKYARPRIAAISVGRTVTPSRQRSQFALVALQVALGLVLLVSAALMIRTFQALRNVDPGFMQPERVLTFSISIPPTEVAEAERVTRVHQEMLQAIGAIPGVASAASTTRLPMDTTGRTSAPIVAEGQTIDSRPISRQIRLISPGLFQALGTRLVAGRDFDWTDIFDRREVAIVTANLAREMWGSPQAAIGKRIREGNTGPLREVVGVTVDLHDQGVHLPPTATAFLPARLHDQAFGVRNFLPRRVSFVVRSDRHDTESLLSEIREAVWSVNANLPLAQVRSLGELYGQSMARTSFTLVMLGIAAVMALLLGVFGIYGVISYAVSQRRREIGIRMALGAQGRDILGLFVRRGLIVTGAGVALGLGGAAGFTQVIRALLFGVSPLDPVVFVAVPVLLGTAALIASYVPARRAMSVNPMETMRVE